MILGALAMLLANAASLLGARALLPLIRLGRPEPDLLLLLLLRLLLISAAVLLAGAAHLLTAAGLGLIGAAALALLLARGAHRGLALRRPAPETRGFAILLGLVLLRLLAQVWILTPYLGDVQAYHLPKVAEWVQAGALTTELGMDRRASFPAGFELIEVWWTVFLHHDVLIEMAGLEFLLLAGVSAAALARELGWSARSARLAALFFILTPALHLQATSGLNDAPVAALIAALTALIVAKASPLLLLIPIGLGMGIKPTFVYALPGLALLAWLGRREIRSAPPSLRSAAGAGIVALAVGAFWYLRNWGLYGNPLHPFGWGGLQTQGAGGPFQRLGPGLQTLRENVGTFLDLRIYDAVFPADSLGQGNANWGAAAFALGVPALIVLLRRDAGLRRVAIGFAASFLIVLSMVELDPWNSRFVLFAALLPALAIARLWEEQAFVRVLGAAALVLVVLSTCLPGTLPRSQFASLFHSEWRTRASGAPPSLPPDGRAVGFCGNDFDAPYPLYGPGYTRRVIYLRETEIGPLLAHAAREGLTRLYVCSSSRKRDLLESGSGASRLVPLREGVWTRYELPPRD